MGAPGQESFAFGQNMEAFISFSLISEDRPDKRARLQTDLVCWGVKIVTKMKASLEVWPEAGRFLLPLEAREPKMAKKRIYGD